eukprot:16432892-Heterocapsa_arctica.AAC.1
MKQQAREKAAGKMQRERAKIKFMEARGVQRGEAHQGETPQKCVQYASIPSAQSRRNDRDRRSREKQHNYVTGLPSFKGANPPSSETTGVQSPLVTSQC